MSYIVFLTKALSEKMFTLLQLYKKTQKPIKGTKP